MAQTVSIHSRLLIVDVLRGFSLSGILLLHALEHFDLLYDPEPLNAFWAVVDPVVSKIVFFIFAGKAYSIFSILFGLSFYIQLKHQQNQGHDFQRFFAWRLTLLLVFGYLLSLVYIGEILSAFALLGFTLLLWNRLQSKLLLLLAILLLAQLPLLYLIFQAFIHPDFVYPFHWGAWEHVFDTFSTGTFCEVVHFNAFSGHLAKWQFFYNTGRYLQLGGLFIIGLLLGRMQYFEQIDRYLKHTKQVMLISAVVFILLYSLPFMITHHVNGVQKELINMLIESYSSFFFTAFLFTGVTWACVQWKFDKKTSLLSAYGKMSLTHYMVQPLIGVPFFYGFGLGMYAYFSTSFSLLWGMTFLVAQWFLSAFWLRYFHYGPFEWLWRALTLKDSSVPFRKR